MHRVKHKHNITDHRIQGRRSCHPHQNCLLIFAHLYGSGSASSEQLAVGYQYAHSAVYMPEDVLCIGEYNLSICSILDHKNKSQNEIIRMRRDYKKTCNTYMCTQANTAWPIPLFMQLATLIERQPPRLQPGSARSPQEVPFNDAWAQGTACQKGRHLITANNCDNHMIEMQQHVQRG